MQNGNQSLVNDLARLVKKDGQFIGKQLGDDLNKAAKMDIEHGARPGVICANCVQSYLHGVVEGLMSRFPDATLDEKSVWQLLAQLSAMVETNQADKEVAQ